MYSATLFDSAYNSVFKTCIEILNTKGEIRIELIREKVVPTLTEIQQSVDNAKLAGTEMRTKYNIIVEDQLP